MEERPAASRNIRYGERLPGAPSFIRRRKEAQRDENNGAFNFSPRARDTAISRKDGRKFTYFHGGHVAPIKQMSAFDLQSHVHLRLIPAIYRAIDTTDNKEVTVPVSDIEKIA